MKPVDIINQFRLDKLNDYEKRVSCWAPFQAMHINKKGRVKVCPFSVQAPHTSKQAQWSPTHTLKQCWNDLVFEEMRTYALEGDLHPEYCEYCLSQCLQSKPPSSLDYDFVGKKRSLSHEYPKEIELELSNVCNYMCDACSPWCSTKWVEKLGLGDDPTFKTKFEDDDWNSAFINDLRSFVHHVDRINFTGGEPFAQRIVYEVLDMIEEEQANDVILHFTTNGSVMNGAVKKIAKRKNTHFTISLDSINPETYPTIRINGVFENVMNNINYLLDNCPGNIGASFVITKKNVMELPDIVSWCNQRGILFSYHILANMGWRDWDKDLKPISVEDESNDYLANLKQFLTDSLNHIQLGINERVTDKNINMYIRYMERLK